MDDDNISSNECRQTYSIMEPVDSTSGRILSQPAVNLSNPLNYEKEDKVQSIIGKPLFISVNPNHNIPADIIPVKRNLRSSDAHFPCAKRKSSRSRSTSLSSNSSLVEHHCQPFPPVKDPLHVECTNHQQGLSEAESCRMHEVPNTLNHDSVNRKFNTLRSSAYSQSSSVKSNEDRLKESTDSCSLYQYKKHGYIEYNSPPIRPCRLGDVSYGSGYESDNSSESYEVSQKNFGNYLKVAENDPTLFSGNTMSTPINLKLNSEPSTGIGRLLDGDRRHSYTNAVACRKRALEAKAEQLKQTERVILEQEEKAQNITWQALTKQEEALKVKEQSLKQREVAAQKKLELAARLMDESCRLSEFKNELCQNNLLFYDHDTSWRTSVSDDYSDNSCLWGSSCSDHPQKMNCFNQKGMSSESLYLSKTIRTYSRIPRRMSREKYSLPNSIVSAVSKRNCCMDSSINYPVNVDMNNTQQILFDERYSVTITPVPNIHLPIRSSSALPCFNSQSKNESSSDLFSQPYRSLPNCDDLSLTAAYSPFSEMVTISTEGSEVCSKRDSCDIHVRNSKVNKCLSNVGASFSKSEPSPVEYLMRDDGLSCNREFFSSHSASWALTKDIKKERFPTTSYDSDIAGSVKESDYHETESRLPKLYSSGIKVDQSLSETLEIKNEVMANNEHSPGFVYRYALNRIDPPVQQLSILALDLKGNSLKPRVSDSSVSVKSTEVLPGLNNEIVEQCVSNASHQSLISEIANNNSFDQRKEIFTNKSISLFQNSNIAGACITPSLSPLKSVSSLSNITDGSSHVHKFQQLHEPTNDIYTKCVPPVSSAHSPKILIKTYANHEIKDRNNEVSPTFLSSNVKVIDSSDTTEIIISPVDCEVDVSQNEFTSDVEYFPPLNLESSGVFFNSLVKIEGNASIMRSNDDENVYNSHCSSIRLTSSPSMIYTAPAQHLTCHFSTGTKSSCISQIPHNQTAMDGDNVEVEIKNGQEINQNLPRYDFPSASAILASSNEESSSNTKYAKLKDVLSYDNINLSTQKCQLQGIENKSTSSDMQEYSKSDCSVSELSVEGINLSSFVNDKDISTGNISFSELGLSPPSPDAKLKICDAELSVRQKDNTSEILNIPPDDVDIESPKERTNVEENFVSHSYIVKDNAANDPPLSRRGRPKKPCLAYSDATFFPDEEPSDSEDSFDYAPRRNKIKLSKKHSNLEENFESHGNIAKENVTNNPPLSRRGRPQKPSLAYSDVPFSPGEEITDNEDSCEYTPQSTTGRKVGRPRKGKKRGRKPKAEVETEDPSDNTAYELIKCGKCDSELNSRKDFKYHVCSVHNGLARPQGESQEFDKKETMKQYLIALAVFGKLICTNCNKNYKTALGFIYHCKYNVCTKISVTATVLCHICHRKVRQATLEKHMVTFHSPEENAVVTKDKSTELRKKTNDLPEFNGEYFAGMFVNIDSTNIPPLLYDDWEIEIEKDKFAVCPRKGCTFQFHDVSSGKNHLDQCISSQLEFLCNLCLKIIPDLTGICNHLTNTHGLDDEASPNDTDKRTTFIEYTKNFRMDNYSTSLFLEMKCQKSDWIPLRRACTHLESKSPYFKQHSNGSNDAAKWDSIPAFIGKVYNGGSIFFAGGPITASAWCPTPSTGCSQVQYIAISANCSQNLNYHVNESISHNGLLQFWKCGTLSKATEPIFSLGISHNFGTAWSMEWCPSGTFEEIDKLAAADSTLKRLGIIAVAFSDSSVRLYCIPHPQQISTDNITFEKQPDLSLLPSSSKMNTQCTKVSWFTGKGHSFIASSFSNGLVCIWNIGNTSSLLKGNDSFGRCCLYPIKSFQAHHGVCSTVSFCPNTNGRHIATGGHDRLIKFWDTTCTDHPLSIIRRGIVTDSTWLPHWAGAIFSFDDCFNLTKGSTVFKENGYFGTTLRSVCGTNSTVRNIDGNWWFNAISQVNEAGEVFLAYHHALSCQTENEHDAQTKRILLFNVHLKELNDGSLISLKEEYNSSIATTDDHIEDAGVNESEIPLKECPADYTAAVQKYGILFTDGEYKDAINARASYNRHKRANELLEPGPLTMHPLMGASTTTWNNNFGAHTWVFVGLNSGFGRLLNIVCLDKLFKKSYNRREE